MKYYVDGFLAVGNPSPLGGGYTIVDEDNNLVHQEVIKRQGYTNNEAELDAVLWAMKHATTGDAVSTDSMTTLTWVRKGSSKARKDLHEKLQTAKSYLQMKKINLMWESREHNLAGIVNEVEEPQKALTQGELLPSSPDAYGEVRPFEIQAGEIVVEHGIEDIEHLEAILQKGLKE